MADFDQSADAVDHSGHGCLESLEGDRLGDGVSPIEVVGGKHSGWDSDTECLDHGVKAEVLAVDGEGRAGLEVHDDLARRPTMGRAEAEINLSIEDDPAVAELSSDA